jgi:hypothetical protein
MERRCILLRTGSRCACDRAVVAAGGVADCAGIRIDRAGRILDLNVLQSRAFIERTFSDRLYACRDVHALQALAPVERILIDLLNGIWDLYIIKGKAMIKCAFSKC